MLVTFLAGCGGGSGRSQAGSPAIVIPSAASTPSVTAQGQLVIAIPVATATATAKRKSQFVSPSANSLGISINGAATTFSDVSASSSICTTANSVRTCTIAIVAPPGNVTIALSLYDRANGAGVLLGGASGTATAVVGQVFTTQIVVNPVLGSASSALASYTNGVAFHPYYASTGTLTFSTLLDPDGNTIPAATAGFAAPVTVTSSDPHVVASPMWLGPSQPITLTYDGSSAVASNVTISVTSGNSVATAVLPIGQYVVSTLAGSLTPGAIDGIGGSAQLYGPSGIAADRSGTIYFADALNGIIRKVTSNGTVTTLNGSFHLPQDVAIDSSGTVYVADSYNNDIRKITAQGVVTTVAGSTTAGSADGTGAAAGFSNPCGIAVDAAGNLYVADVANNKVRKVTPAGVVTTLAGNGSRADVDGQGASASFASPVAIRLNAAGDIYVADAGGIRKITQAGAVSTLAGSVYLAGLAIDIAGNVYGTSYITNQIVMVTPAGVVKPFAGSGGTAGSANGPAATAKFNYPVGIAIDPNGVIYVGDYENNEIRKISP